MADLVDEYTARIYRLLPRGPIWPQESREGSVWDALIMALAEEPARVHDTGDEWLYDYFPDQSEQQLSSWETLLSLPDCEEDLGTVEQRQSRIVAKLRSRGTCTLDTVTAVAQAYDATATVTEDLGGSMFRVGSDAMGDALGGDAWASTLTVTYTYSGDTLIECAVGHAVPAHCTVLFVQV
jgi:uncharacterized protein YmfQ (DUF2313 family)